MNPSFNWHSLHDYHEGLTETAFFPQLGYFLPTPPNVSKYHSDGVLALTQRCNQSTVYAIHSIKPTVQKN